jgi:dihydrofolate reductase
VSIGALPVRRTGMSTIAINMFLTLDGVAQAPGGPDEDREGGFEHGGWQKPFFTEQLGEVIGPWHSGAGGFLLGRKTYEIFAAYWPHIPADHENAAMAKIIDETPRYVASRTLTSTDWAGTTVLGDEVAGSIDFAQTLIAHDLVDEYRLTVFPVVLGTGKRLFGSGAVPSRLKLVSSRTTDAGVVACVYRPTGKPEYDSYAL